MTSKEIRKRFIEFFEKREHAVIPSASLVPEGDSSVLFNTAGMQPLIPYILGKEHPAGKRLVDSQKCVRTVDIDGIGDNTHVTFFEMLGNWSLGDYWKRDVIQWWYEFLTSETEGLALNPERLYVTCFEGDDNASRDEESYLVWNELFQKNKVKGERVYYRGAETNWWSVGDDGPCGPDSEMFYDLTGSLTKGMTLDEYIKADDEQKIVEAGNNVFMQYLKKDGKVVGELPRKNVDTGSGFERLVMAVQGKTNIFDTDLFSSVITYIRENCTKENILSERIVADHIRTATFMIADGVIASNTDRGYILRRLLRRAVRHADILGLKADEKKKLGRLTSIASIFIEQYAEVYPNLVSEVNKIYDEIEKEENKFKAVLDKALKEFEKVVKGKTEITASEVFNLQSSHGLPIDITLELAKEKGIIIDEKALEEHIKEHQELSRKGAEQKFKAVLE